MKKAWFLIIFLIVLCFILLWFLPKSTIGSHPIEHLDYLLVNVGDFPAGWKEEYQLPVKGRYDWGEENIDLGLKLISGQGFAHQYVYQFSNPLESMYAHYFLERELSIKKENLIDFLPYKSQIANDWHLGCINSSSNGVICDALGRYEDFVIYFSITVPHDQLTPAQLEKILQSIDDRMEKHLKK